MISLKLVRNIKVALRRLRKFSREGAETELDLPDTIKSTAQNGGYLDIRMVPEQRNTVKVLLFLDAGGSMDDHVKVCEELFSAARAEFKHMEFFTFITACMRGSGKIIAAVMAKNLKQWRFLGPTLLIIR